MGGNPGASEPDQGLGTDSIAQADDKTAYDASSDVQSLFQGRRRRLRRREFRGRELRRRFDDQCFDFLISAADYIAGQDQLQIAATPSVINSNSVPPPQIDGIIPDVIAAVQKDSSVFATVQVTQHLQNADGTYILDISILDNAGNMINDMQNQKAPPETEMEVQVPWDSQLPPDSPAFTGPKNHPLYVSMGKNPQDPLKFFRPVGI